MIVSSDEPLLLGGGSGAGASPWAIAAERARIRVLDSVINAVILTSAWSAGNSYPFLASRTLYSIALVGNAPRIFARCTKSGIPYFAILPFGISQRLRFRCNSLQLVRQPHQHRRIHELDLDLSYLPSLPQSHICTRHHGSTIPLSIPTIHVLRQWLDIAYSPTRQWFPQLHPWSLEYFQLSELPISAFPSSWRFILATSLLRAGMMHGLSLLTMWTWCLGWTT